MKAYWGMELLFQALLTSALDSGEWLSSCFGRFTPRERTPRYPLDRRLGRFQRRSGRGGEAKNIQPRRESNTRTQNVQPVVQRGDTLTHRENK
jgi:hypothetical protein